MKLCSQPQSCCWVWASASLHCGLQFQHSCQLRRMGTDRHGAAVLYVRQAVFVSVFLFVEPCHGLSVASSHAKWHKDPFWAFLLIGLLS